MARHRKTRDADGQLAVSAVLEFDGSDSSYTPDGREYMREYMAKRRASGRVVEFTPVADPVLRKSCERDLLLYCRSYFPHLFFKPLSDTHLEIIHQLEATILHGGKIALAAPRGYGKTTITLVAISWAIVYGHAHYIVLICSEGGLAQERLEELQHMFDDPEKLLARDFPDACAPVIALEGSPQRAAKQLARWADGAERRTRIKWEKHTVRFGRVPSITDPSADAPCSGTIVKAKGLDSAIRGLVQGELRPDLVLPDDPQTDDVARSPKQIEQRHGYLRGCIEGLAGPGSSLRVISLWTVIQKGDLADIYTSGAEPDYRAMRFQAMPDMPADKQLLDEYIARVRDAKRRGDHKARAAHAWYLLNRARVESGARVAWPANFVSEDVGNESMRDALQCGAA